MHVRALAEQVERALMKVGRKAHHVEGVRAGRWALLDYIDFVVHVFHPTLRAFYQLERLWADAPATRVGATAAASTSATAPNPRARSCRDCWWPTT